MESEIQINNTAGVCQIDIEGTIGVPEEWQFEEPDARVATYERFRDTLRRIAEIEAPEVVVNIRSTGGDVNDALLIHDALRQLPARVTTRCYGYTASAATIIAQAASEGCRLLSANALYLIHTAICSTEGNAAEIAGKILKLVEEDPAKKNQAATFLNYYLPTTEKLLDSYADFEEAGVSGENLTQAKEKIRRTMDSIMAGFERQLDALYHADAMDVDSDIRVMETMLRRDGGSVEEDFGLGGTAVATQEDL
jgi:hypothetical protein